MDVREQASDLIGEGYGRGNRRWFRSDARHHCKDTGLGSHYKRLPTILHAGPHSASRPIRLTELGGIVMRSLRDRSNPAMADAKRRREEQSASLKERIVVNDPPQCDRLRFWGSASP